jgi:hypothetical protein
LIVLIYLSSEGLFINRCKAGRSRKVKNREELLDDLEEPSRRDQPGANNGDRIRFAGDCSGFVHCLCSSVFSITKVRGFDRRFGWRRLAVKEAHEQYRMVWQKAIAWDLDNLPEQAA